MRDGLRRAWPVLKAVLGLTILVLIGRQFARDLGRPELWDRPLHYSALSLSGVLYLAGLGWSAGYWQRLLAGLGERLPMRAAVRAYYIGHLGKYLPGKAWALLLRAGLARDAGVRVGPATVTAFYEVLTTMAAGALLAALLYTLFGPTGGADATALWRLARLEVPEAGVGRALVVPLALGLAAATGLPLVPPLFNRLIGQLSLPFRDASVRPPQMRSLWLVEGLLLTAIGWLFLGASLVACLHGVVGELSWSVAALARITAGLAVAYVAGFVILIAPGGLGVREFFLTLFLAPELESAAALSPDAARGTAVLTVIVVRLVWTAAELLLATLLYCIPASTVSLTSDP